MPEDTFQNSTKNKWVTELAYALTIQEAEQIVDANMPDYSPLQDWRGDGYFVCDVLEELAWEDAEVRASILGVFLGKVLKSGILGSFEDFITKLHENQGRVDPRRQ